MPKEHEKIKYPPGEKSLKAPFIVHADLERLLKKCDFRITENSYREEKLSTNLRDTHGSLPFHWKI